MGKCCVGGQLVKYAIELENMGCIAGGRGTNWVGDICEYVMPCNNNVSHY